jgi:hypothetical protein
MDNKLQVLREVAKLVDGWTTTEHRRALVLENHTLRVGVWRSADSDGWKAELLLLPAEPSTTEQFVADSPVVAVRQALVSAAYVHRGGYTAIALPLLQRLRGDDETEERRLRDTLQALDDRFHDEGAYDGLLHAVARPAMPDGIDHVRELVRALVITTHPRYRWYEGRVRLLRALEGLG